MSQLHYWINCERQSKNAGTDKIAAMQEAIKVYASYSRLIDVWLYEIPANFTGNKLRELKPFLRLEKYLG